MKIYTPSAKLNKKHASSIINKSNSTMQNYYLSLIFSRSSNHMAQNLVLFRPKISCYKLDLAEDKSLPSSQNFDIAENIRPD